MVVGRAIRLLLGALLVITGFLLLLALPVSVWRVSGEVLDELPPVEGAEVGDTRHRVSALRDPLFIVARRTWTGTTVDEVRRVLLDDGFDTWTAGRRSALAKPCCGDYDAVVVDLVDGPEPGQVEARLTTADGDVQGAAVIFTLLGLALAVPGLGLLATARTPTEPPTPDRRHPAGV